MFTVPAPIRHILPLMLAGLFAVFNINTAFAHGSDEPQHGGVVKITGEISFELVNLPDRVEVYLLDDGELLQTEKLSAKIKVKSDNSPRFITMESAGGNRFVTKGENLPAGAKVLVLVTMEDGYSKIGANFAID